jgi:RimJ/RimL family protein N-acetyltransferase
MMTAITPLGAASPQVDDARCELLDWDTRFWGFSVARVKRERIERAAMRAIDAWCWEHAIRCLYFLADDTDPTPHHAPESCGFRLVDIRTTLVYRQGRSQCSPPAAGITIRDSRPADVPMLRLIARHSYDATRFFRDPNFPRERCHRLYETWIARSCYGYADVVLVAERAGRPIGYLSCHLAREATRGVGRAGSIGLVGVSAEARGTGVGQALVAAGLDWFAARGVERVDVVTQGENRVAIRLYERCGFTLASAQRWYHKWYQNMPSPLEEG